jgi:hypothetical protein
MRLNNFLKFILESNFIELIKEANIQYKDDFIEILDQMKSPIADKLLQLSGKDRKITTNYLGIGDKDGEITFYSTNKKLDNRWEIVDGGYTFTSFVDLFRSRGLKENYYPSLEQFTKGRVDYIFEPGVRPNTLNRTIAHFISDSGENCFIDIRGLRQIPDGEPEKTSVGRIVRRILDSDGQKASDKELEEFVNEFKSKVSIKKNRHLLFELVEGEKITHYYSHKRYDYTKENTLQGSCMRYDRCQDYLSIYVSNPEVCKLLILKSPSNQELIIGRALVWKLDSGDTFMDRIYYTYDSDVELFKDYAIKNGWCYKSAQDPSEDTSIEFEPKRRMKGDLTVTLKYAEFRYYPYLDTLKYLSIGYPNSQISNTRIEDDDFYLEDTDGGNGGCETCNGSGRTSCYECEGDGRVDCDDCDSGEVECSECDGNGNTSCSRCDGEGQIEGDEEGEMKDCPYCNGDGHIDCDECNGRGKLNCSRCDGDGRYDCAVCDGDGNLDCPDC